MKVKLADSFVHKLDRQIDFIARDKPSAARKFKQDVLNVVKGLSDKPFAFRRSIYFDNDNIRDATFKGYKIVYKVDKTANEIVVFGFVKDEESV